MLALSKEHRDALPIEAIAAAYRKTATLRATSSYAPEHLAEAMELMREGLAAAGKPVLQGAEAKAALPRLKAQMIRRLDRAKFLGKSTNKALASEICYMIQKLIVAVFMMEIRADGLMIFCMWANLLEAAEDADEPENLLWTYSNAYVIMQAVPQSLHPLFRIRLPKIYYHFAEVDTERFQQQMYALLYVRVSVFLSVCVSVCCRCA